MTEVKTGIIKHRVEGDKCILQIRFDTVDELGTPLGSEWRDATEADLHTLYSGFYKSIREDGQGLYELKLPQINL